MQVTPEEFIKAWQTSETTREVAEKLGSMTRTVTTRAMYYRKKGIPLKKMLRVNQGRKALDIAKLQALAESLNSKPTSGESQ